MTIAFGAFWRRYGVVITIWGAVLVVLITGVLVIEGAFSFYKKAVSKPVVKESLTPRPLFGNAGEKLGAEATQNIQEAVERAVQAMSDARIREITINVEYVGDDKEQ